ncbi:NAD(P)-dependent oxidoreductase [Silvibacterium sp.]|uniref:NAD(P)-dependent oxidoreductase n=1 Tax=Silvibacterium sp. TaxID=1964179 RepID=UPI0039E42F74
MRIAFLGLGRMGTPIALHLLRAGHTLTVWNRTAERAQPVVAAGATLAETPADAVREAEAVFTMVTDDTALTHLIDQAKLLEALPAGAVHIALSTISVALSQRLTVAHAAHSQGYVGSPVFGRPNFAEEGRLWTVLAGLPEHVATAKPLVETFSRGVTVIGEDPASAHALKLGGNFLITAMIASLSEAMTYAEANAIDPGIFLETVNNALFQSTFYANYSKVMLHPPAEAAATIALGEKDTRLFREAAEHAGVTTPLADSFAANFRRAIDADMQDADWAAGYYRFVRETTGPQG